MSSYDPEVVQELPAVVTASTDSAEVNTLGKKVVALITPSGLTSTSVSFLVRKADGTFVPMYQNGALVSMIVGASQYIPVPDPLVFIGVQALKIKLSASETKTVTLVTREL